MIASQPSNPRISLSGEPRASFHRLRDELLRAHGRRHVSRAFALFAVVLATVAGYHLAELVFEARPAATVPSSLPLR